MIRSFLIEAGLFLLPFVAYALYLAALREKIIDPQSWPMRHVVGLSIAALVLVALSLIYLAHFSGAPPGSTYSPARVEDGRFIPGGTR
jgi:tellurite resistance protein TehA-like permease